MFSTGMVSAGMSRLRRAGCGVLLLFASIGLAQATAVPGVLRDWTGWALHGHEHLRCPALPGSEGHRLCAWPGTLDLRVDASGARFSQRWQVLEREQLLALPGDARWRPESVTVNDRPAPVLIRDGRPVVRVAPGQARIAGRIVWPRRPATLMVPDATALIDLTVDGQAVEAVQREDDEVVLGDVERVESDTLNLEVARLLADGTPAVLLTHVTLWVAGRPREVRLGPVLPEGYVAMAVGGELPVRLDAEGSLRVQVRSGHWQITLAARAGSPLEGFSIPRASAPWPEEELLQFQFDPRLRLAQLSGLSALDPDAHPVPDWEDIDWGLADDVVSVSEVEVERQTLRLRPEDSATLMVRQRGLPEDRPAQLRLERELWLDFDGAAFSVHDQIQGDPGSLRRLDMLPPWQVQRAELDDRDVLLTEAPTTALEGLEVRNTSLDLSVASRVPRDHSTTGWGAPFSTASLTLHLPPGYRLLAATGADHAVGSWWGSWSLLDLFLASLIVVIGWRLGRWPLVGLTAGFVLLAWHEPDAPRLGLLIALALALVVGSLPAGRWRRLVRAGQGIVLVLLVLTTLSFAVGQIKLSLFPQLEYGAVESSRYARHVSYSASPPPAPPAPPVLADAPIPESFEPERRRAEMQGKAVASEEGSLDRIEVTGARIDRAELFSYPADAIPQAGAAMPDWSWRRHAIVWNGPLLPADDLGLLISPPGLTRLWRLLGVLLLASVLVVLIRQLRQGGDADSAEPEPKPKPKPEPEPEPEPESGRSALASSSVAMVLLSILLAVAPTRVAVAQTHAPPVNAIPDAGMIDTLRERLLSRREPCQPDCIAYGVVRVTGVGNRIDLIVELHAQADGVVRLPRPNAETVLISAALEGAAVPLHRFGDQVLVQAAAGVSSLRLSYLGAGRSSLRFPIAPARIEVNAPGFRIEGIDEGRLTGDTLALTAPIDPDPTSTGSDAVRTNLAAAPFVRVQRVFDLDREWSVQTTVQRVAPAEGGFEVEVALLPGERILDEPLPMAQGRVRVAFSAADDEVSWSSQLTPEPTLTLVAGDQRQYSEEWRVYVTQLLHASHDGLPLSPDSNGAPPSDGVWWFLPFPNETLNVQISRPPAIERATLAIENVRLHSSPGRRATEHRLNFDLRSTRAGDYRLALPEGAQLIALSLDGQSQPTLLSDGAVILPLAVGTRAVFLVWRQDVDSGAVLATPAIDLGASSATIRISLALPMDRWLVWLAGPGIGPALLLWPLLIVLIGLAWALGRWGGTPLAMHHWLLLGLGFAMVSWPAAVVFFGWLLILGWRGRAGLNSLSAFRFNALQVLLAVVTMAAMATLLLSVPLGLLGSPDMGVTGNGSTPGLLNWFVDRVEGPLPSARAYTLPLWLYKAALLIWSLWLAQALLGWLRWAWQCFSHGGGWRARGT